MAVRRIDASQRGGRVRVAAGDLVQISLPENPSTGYRWELDRLPVGTHLVGDHVERRRQAAPGAAGLRVLTIRVHKGGTLSACLRRAWEAAAPVATFTVTVTVDD